TSPSAPSRPIGWRSSSPTTASASPPRSTRTAPARSASTWSTPSPSSSRAPWSSAATRGRASCCASPSAPSSASCAAAPRSFAVERIDPAHLLGRLGGREVEVHDHRLLARAHDDALQLLAGRGVDLLVRHERRDVDEVAGAGLGDELEPLAPAHAGAA